MENLMQKKGIRQTKEQFEEWLQRKQSLRNQRTQALRQQAGPYKIPVVVHLIYTNEDDGTFGWSHEIISDSRVFSQLDVLNNDFKRLNADASSTPSEFQPVAGAMDIEFILAKQTPEGDATTGINRVYGGQAFWSPFDEDLHTTSYWPSEDYLNIWVTDIGSNFLGYAQFPVSNLPGLEDFQDGIAVTDGVVIDYTVFGVGSSDPDYNLGRTATHEVGHFLGLRHIWGDDSGCEGTDYVSDTPNQLQESDACPSHPTFECGNNKMFQNYMDYTDDVCMNLFTEQQVNRMMLILEDTDVPRRNSLLTSLGLDDPIPGTIDLEVVSMTQPGPVTCDETPDLHLKVINHSSETITDLKVKVSLNGSTELVNLTGLNLNGAGEISFPSREMNIGENDLLINVIQINGATDPVKTNNVLETTITIIYEECEPFAIYGNVSGMVKVTFNLEETQPVDLIITDMIGRQLEHHVLPEAYNQTYILPTGDASTGLYIFRLQIGHTYYTTKVYLSP
jgi:hypothetical protein